MRLLPSKRPRGGLEARIWTGPAAHLLGGTLDLVQALSRYARARARGLRS